VLEVERGGRVLGLVPLVRRGRSVALVGGVALTDYCGPLCGERDLPDVLAGLLGWTAATGAEADLRNTRPELELAPRLRELAGGDGLRVSSEPDSPAAVLRLPSSFDDYLASLTPKRRHELRRKLRRFSRELPSARTRLATAATLERDLETFVALHRRARGPKASFMQQRVAGFFRSVAEAFHEAGWLRLHVLEAEGRPLAATFGFACDGVYYLYNSAYEPRMTAVAPGLALVTELVRDGIEERLRVFDFLRGVERYKLDLGAEVEQLVRIRLERRPEPR
jgi:CelD/BcsL family acetyltransferase involved in cellulose biosynthesis